MNYLMLLSLMIPVTIILFLVSALFKEETNFLFDKKPENKPSGKPTNGELCHQEINNSSDRKDPKNYIDLSGGNWGI